MEQITEDVLQVNHRHVIFTIDDGLRNVFLLHRHLLKDLIDAVGELNNGILSEESKGNSWYHCRTTYIWFKSQF